MVDQRVVNNDSSRTIRKLQELPAVDSSNVPDQVSLNKVNHESEQRVTPLMDVEEDNKKRALLRNSKANQEAWKPSNNSKVSTLAMAVARVHCIRPKCSRNIS